MAKPKNKPEKPAPESSTPTETPLETLPEHPDPFLSEESDPETPDSPLPPKAPAASSMPSAQSDELGSLTLGEAAAINQATDPKRRRNVIEAIKRSRAKRAAQRAEIERVGKRNLEVGDDGKIKGLNYGVVVALQARDKEYWQRVKGDPKREDNLLRAYERRTQASREEIMKYLES